MTQFEEQEYSTSFSVATWKRIFSFMKPHSKYVIISTVIVIIIAFIDIALPMLNAWLIDDIIKPGNVDKLKYYAIFYSVLVIIQAINVYLFIRYAGKVEVELAYDLRIKSFNKLQELSFSYFDKTPAGWVIARLTSDARRLSEILSWGLIDVSWGLMMMVGIAIVLMIINFKLALITLAVIPILIILSYYFNKLILKSYRQVRKINSKITGAFNEGITGAKTTKTLVLEEKNNSNFNVLTSDMKRYSIRAVTYSSLYFPLVMLLGFLGTALVLYYGGIAVTEEMIQIGKFTLFITFSTQFFEPVMQLARILAELQQAQASAERIISLIETDAEIVDEDEVIDKYGDSVSYKRENWEELKGEITFNDVTFQYKNGEKVLNNFNLHVNAGSTVALVGETGAGKSTIVNLICRFYEPTSGEIKIDGKNYRERSLAWLHNNLGYVLQSPHLFSGSILDNIRYGRLDATDEEIYAAAKVVNAHEFIINLEEGYSTNVGEGGARLSTGQKQLVSFARAILANPSILILDEATSSIDTETEKIVQGAIEKLLVGRTSFIIAHRLSTIVNADIIIVLKAGNILEQGTHEELLENKGYYYRLYTNQFVEEQLQNIGI